MVANRLGIVACVGFVVVATASAQRPAQSFSGTRVQPVQATTPLLPPTTMAPPVGVPGQPYAASDVLTMPATGLPNGAYPPGTVYSPLATSGGNGPITYETYLNTGPSILAGNSTLTNSVKSGWVVAGGVRTLLFNPTNDAAWVFDLGVSYTRNSGKLFDSPIAVAAKELKFGDINDNSLINLGVRGVSRTSLNFAIGRDWWLNGPGTTGQETFGNWRVGGDVGGRYGTGSIDFAPVDEPTGYRRRQGVFHGLFLGGHLDWERPFGAFTAYAGLRTEWSYTWSNLIPPNNGDFVDVNIMMSFGIRY